jgi:hypothetical protein
MGKWTLAVAILAAGAWGRNSEPEAVVVARIDNIQPLDFVIAARAKTLASVVLRRAGVRLEWGKDIPDAETIEIRMESNASEHTPPDVMAYALPYSRGSNRIHIFSDRVRKPHVTAVETVLAYVIAHEIVHVLEGCGRHSDDGVMKARWTGSDYVQMAFSGLEFSDVDLQLLRAHFEKRAAEKHTLPDPATSDSH